MGFGSAGARLRHGSVADFARVYAATGKLMEKCDVVSRKPGREYKLQDGFGCTNGVTAASMLQYPDCQAAKRER